MTTQFSVNATPVSAVGAMPIIGSNRLASSAALPFYSRTLTRSLTGRSNAVSAASNSFGTGGALVTGLCQHQRIVLAGDFDAVQIAIPNMHTASVSNVLASVGVSSSLGAWNTVAPTANNTGQNTAASPSPTETVSSSGTGVWRSLTFGGASSATLPAAIDASNLVPSWTWSDWAPVYSVPRVDGGTLPIVDVRLFIPAAAGSITLAYTGVSNNAWAVAGRDDLYTGGRAYRVWNQDTDGVTTPANFTTVATQPMVVPILVRYRSRNAGWSVLSVGDSIYEGTAGSTYPANNFVWKACVSLSTTATPVEYCSINAAGASTIQLIKRLEQVASTIAPSIIVAQSASVNNFGISLGSRVQQEGQGTAGVMQALAMKMNCALILGSMFPVTNAAKAWGTTDSQRVTLNSTLASLSGTNGYTWCNFGQVFDGVSNGGQVEPVASLVSGDGFHPNDAGQTALSAPMYDALVCAMQDNKTTVTP